MKKIAEIVSRGKVEVNDLTKTTRMCSLDTTEVTDMLAHLTTYGRVEQAGDQWKITKTEDVAIYGRFRKVFLREVELILKNLTEIPQSVSQISEVTKVSSNKVSRYLPFLKLITKHGVISRCSSDYPITWCLLK